jgi:phosphatidylethanolamine-binding protein (PEBP) family uncharacterized protein
MHVFHRCRLRASAAIRDSRTDRLLRRVGLCKGLADMERFLRYRPRGCSRSEVVSLSRAVPVVRSTVILVLALAGLAACGSSAKSSEGTAASTDASSVRSQVSTTAASSQKTQTQAPQTTATQAEKVPDQDIKITSPVSLKQLPAHYTCDGADVSLPLRWSKIPAGTKDLDLFIVSALPVNGKFEVAWAVAGLKPSLRGLTSGRLPSGATVGANSSGQARYSLCPPHGKKSEYAILLYALPHKVPVKRGFDAEALIEGTLVHVAPSEGEAFAYYQRK